MPKEFEIVKKADRGQELMGPLPENREGVNGAPISLEGQRGYTIGTDTAYGTAFDGDSGSLIQYWHILSPRKGTLLLAALLGALAAFSLTMLQSPLYRAQTLLEIESLNQDFLNMRNVSPTASNAPFQSPEYDIRTQLAVLQSRPVMERAIDKMDIEKRLLASAQGGRTFLSLSSPATRKSIPAREQAISLAAAALRVRAEPSTRVISVTFDSPDSQLAADFVNSIAAGFTEVTFEKRRRASEYTSKWLVQELQDVKTKLEQAEDALQTYARASDLTFISEKDNAAEERLRQLQLEISRAQADRVAKQSQYELATTAPAESLPEVLDDATLKQYQVTLTSLRRELAELSYSFTAEHPKVAKALSQIGALEAALARERSNILSRIKNEYEAARRREKLLSETYSAQAGLMSRQADKVTRYLILKREVDSTRQLHDSLFQRVKEAELASAMRATHIQVLESATPPKTPYKPNFFLNTAFGLLSGLCTAAALVIVRARSERRIQEPGETHLHLKVPELGVIPAVGTELSPLRRLLDKSGLQTPSPADSNQLELATWQQWPSAIAESFRLTLTSILLSEKSRVRPRVIVLSSANPGEGKTTVISNLAIALARVNRRVLLVDGDLWRPRLHKLFNVENIGLSEALAGSSSSSVWATKIPNLYVLPSGKCADERLLFTPQLGQLLLRLKAEFDMILIDTPPLLHMSDARLMAHHADAVIMVVAQNTPLDAVLLAKQHLAEDGTHLLGTILNNWDPKSSVRRRYGYYAYNESYRRKDHSS